MLTTGDVMPLKGVRVGDCEDEVVYEKIQDGDRMILITASVENLQSIGQGIQRALGRGICKREDLFVSLTVDSEQIKSQE